MSRRLLGVVSPLLLLRRARGYQAPGGVRYPGGITYYPRYPDQKDPECTPSKLFRIERIKPVKGTPWFHRQILKAMKLDEFERVAIVKNIPEINARLWKIKHLIKVTPIVFPYGEPTSEDIKYTVLKQNGQCIVTKKLEVHQKVIEAFDKYQKNPKKMDGETLKRDSRLKWLNPWSGGY